MSINRDTGMFTTGKNGDEFPGIEGEFLGITSHQMEFKGDNYDKFDIYLKDNGAIYQIQFGLYSWLTLGIMNSMRSIENLKIGGKLFLSMKKSNDKDGNINLYLNWNNKPLKWKSSFEELGFTKLAKKDKDRHKDGIIDKWYNALFERVPFFEEISEPSVNSEDAPELDDEAEPVNGTAGTVKLEDIPF